MASLRLWSLVSLVHAAASLQTYSVVTRVRAYQEQPVACQQYYLFDNSSGSGSDGMYDSLCASLTNSMSEHFSVSACQVYRVTCDRGLSTLHTLVDISGSDQPTNQQLHQSVSLSHLSTSGRLSVDLLQIHDFNECKAGRHDCSANGLCTNLAGTYRCTCRRDFLDGSAEHGLADGRVCNGRCGDTICLNSGVCSEVDGAQVCACADEFTGPTCAVRKKEVEWLWILGITLVLFTLIVVPAGVCVYLLLRNRRKTSRKLPFQRLG